MSRGSFLKHPKKASLSAPNLLPSEVSSDLVTLAPDVREMLSRMKWSVEAPAWGFGKRRSVEAEVGGFGWSMSSGRFKRGGLGPGRIG